MINTQEDILGTIVLFTLYPLRQTHLTFQEVNCVTSRVDIIYIPNGSKPAIIIELNVDKTEDVATN